MIKAYEEMISVRIGANLVTMTIVEKQNQSGLKFNQRLLVLVHDQYLGYISKVKVNQAPEQVLVEEAKVKIPIKNLYTSEVDQNLIRIRFTQQVQGKLIPKEWILRIPTNRLAELWKQMIDYQVKNKTKKDASKGLGSQKKSSVRKSTSKQQKKPQQIEEIKLKTIINESTKTTQQVKMTGSFDNSLFDDDSDGEDTRRKKKSPEKKSIAPAAVPKQSPPKIDNTERDPQIIVKPPIVQSASPEKKARVPPIQVPSQSEPIPGAPLMPSHREKSNSPQKDDSGFKRSQVKESPLPEIKEEPIEHTPKNESNMINNYERRTPPKQLEPLSNKKSVSIISKQKSLTSEEKDVLLIAQLCQKMQLKNEKYPFKQISYDHKEFLEFIRPYQQKLKNVNLSNQEQVQRIMQAVLQTMKKRKEMRQVEDDCNVSQDWVYRQVTQDETIVIMDFRTHCEGLMRELVREMYNHQWKKFTKVTQEDNILHVQFKDIRIRVPLTVLQETESHINMLNTSSLKALRLQFKSLEYLHSLTLNRGHLRVPLSCLCHYNGLTAFFKHQPVFYSHEKYSEFVNKQLHSLQDISCLPMVRLLKNSIKPLNEFHYNEMKKGGECVQFKFFFIDDVKKLFAYDINMGVYGEKRVLRRELVEGQINRKVLPWCTLQDLQNEDNPTAKRQMTFLAAKLSQRIQKLSHSFNHLQHNFVQPSELSALLHSHGINMRYLGQLYLKTDCHFVRSLFMSEMMGRTVKKLLSKTLQDICLEDTQAIYPTQEELDQNVKNRVTDFMNCLFGNTLQTDALWELVQQNAQYHFEVELESYRSVSKGQLLVSVAQHCGLQLNWKSVNASSVFTTNTFLKSQHIKALKIKTKSYTPSMSLKTEIIPQRLQAETRQNFTSIVSTLNLTKQSLPPWISLFPNLSERVRLFLGRFIEPDQLDWSTNYAHLSLYTNETPSTPNYRLHLAKIQWYLRKSDRFKYLTEFGQFTDNLSKLYGNYHPLMSELYQLFADYHQKKGQLEDALHFMQSSVVNISALCGDNNRLINQKWFKMYQLLSAANKPSQAYEYLQKIKRNIQNSAYHKVALYGKVKVEIAAKLYREGKIEQALQEIQNVGQFIQIYQKEELSYEQERTKLYVILYNCYNQLNKTKELSEMCTKLEKKLNCFKNHINVQEIVWIIVSSRLNSCSSVSKNAIIETIKSIKTKQGIHFYKKALKFILQRNEEKNLFVLMRKYSENSEKIFEMAAQKRIFLQWKNLEKVYQRQSLFDYVSLWEQFIYFFGRDRLESIWKGADGR